MIKVMGREEVRRISSKRIERLDGREYVRLINKD